MPSLIINCKDIKSDVSKKKKGSNSGVRILYYIGMKGSSCYPSNLGVLPDAGQVSVTVLPTVFTSFMLALAGSPQSLGTYLEQQENPEAKSSQLILRIFYNVEVSMPLGLRILLIRRGRNILKTVVT